VGYIVYACPPGYADNKRVVRVISSRHGNFRLLVEGDAPNRQVRCIVDGSAGLNRTELARADAAAKHLLPPTPSPDGHMGGLIRSDTTTGYLYRYAGSLGVLLT